MATPEQTMATLPTIGACIELAVDVRLGVLEGGGEYHPDCEEALLARGSAQADVWGAH